MLFMNGSRLKKLNGADTSAAVENDILGAGYAPFEEGALEGLAAMEIFKARGRRTRRRKKRTGNMCVSTSTPLPIAPRAGNLW